MSVSGRLAKLCLESKLEARTNQGPSSVFKVKLQARTGKHQTLRFDRDAGSIGKQRFEVFHGVCSFAPDRETP